MANPRPTLRHDVGDAVLFCDALCDARDHLARPNLIAAGEALVEQRLQRVLPEHRGRDLRPQNVQLCLSSPAMCCPLLPTSPTAMPAPPPAGPGWP